MKTPSASDSEVENNRVRRHAKGKGKCSAPQVVAKIKHPYPKVVYMLVSPYSKAYHLSVNCPRLIAATEKKIEAVDLCKVCYKSSETFPMFGRSCHDKVK